MSETNFQPGDIVRCLYGEQEMPSKGCIYRISRADVHLVDLDVPEFGNGWYADRFELVYRPDDPKSWKPKPGDPVRFTNPDLFDIEKVYTVTSDATGSGVSGVVWVEFSNDAKGWDFPYVWISQGLVPLTTAEAAEGLTPKPEIEPAEVKASTADVRLRDVQQELSDFKQKSDEVVESLKAEVERYRSLAESRATDLRNFREQVREAVISEAEARDWCDDVNEWLDQLGLEEWDRAYGLPTGRYAVVRLNSGNIAILHGSESESWLEYDKDDGCDTGKWWTFRALSAEYEKTIFEGDTYNNCIDLRW